jgi:hypothetical protein
MDATLLAVGERNEAQAMGSVNRFIYAPQHS